MLNPDVDGCERTRQWLTAEANQAWKDTNDVLLSHQLRYNAELMEFIAEKTLHAKCTEIWRHVTCIAEMAHLSPEAGLCLTLHVVGSLPTIPVNLCFCGVIPMLLAYCPETYSLQTWDPEEDGDYLLDADARASGMLSRKFAHIEGSAPVDSHSPRCAPSPAGSTGSIGSGTSLPPGGHILHTRSGTPLWTREQSSSSSSSSHCLSYGTGSHESEGSGSRPGRQSDTEQDDEVNKCAPDNLAGEESDGNAEEWDKSKKIHEGCKAWKTHSMMACKHRDPGKEIKCKDLAGPPVDYMASCNVFKVKQTSRYDLCHFYQVGESGDLPPFPSTLLASNL